MSQTANLTSKLPNVGTTIFTVMSQLAAEHNALNLSQGFPNFQPPQRLRDLINHHIEIGHNQYAPMSGVPVLREQIARKVQQLYHRPVSMDAEITVTSGATEALYVAITAVVNPGDEVLVFDPAYDSYEPAITLNGGRTIHLPLMPPDFSIDWQRVRDSISPRTRLIMLNSPHNPTGSILSQSDLDNLADITRDTDILLISDEVYEHIVFDNQQHYSLLRHEALAARAFVISSFGKTYHATGWKIGYCIAPHRLSEEFRKVHQFVNFSITTPMQFALADFMAECPEFHQELPQFYQQKRDLFCELMRESRFSFTPTPSTFFQLLDYSEITDMADVEYARHLTTELGVAAIPISVFYEQPPDHHILRFCFAKQDETLQQAAERLCKI